MPRHRLILASLLLYLSTFLLVIGLQANSVFLIPTLPSSFLTLGLKTGCPSACDVITFLLFFAYSLRLNLNIISQNSLPCFIDSVRVPQCSFLRLLRGKYLFKCLLFFDFSNRGINSMQWKTFCLVKKSTHSLLKSCKAEEFLINSTYHNQFQGCKFPKSQGP